jgi:hypothetical protein
MNTRVQAFVGGAIAVIGFRALIWIPHGVAARDSVYILAGILVGFGLPLGVAILRGHPKALRLAEIYLALGVLGMCLAFVVSKLSILPASAPGLAWWSLSDLIAPVVLLVLLFWSKAQHGEENVAQVEAPNERE